MKTGTGSQITIVPVVPMDDDTHGMLAYVESPEGRARIEQARKEIDRGEGIVVCPAYRIDKRSELRAALDIGLAELDAGLGRKLDIEELITRARASYGSAA